MGRVGVAGRGRSGKTLDFFPLQTHNQGENFGGKCVVTELFAELEQKLENVLGQVEGLKQANAQLKSALAAREQALKEAQTSLDRLTRERETVRERVDKILNRLKILDLGDSA